MVSAGVVSRSTAEEPARWPRDRRWRDAPPRPDRHRGRGRPQHVTPHATCHCHRVQHRVDQHHYDGHDHDNHPLIIYRVKRGDSLTKIANHFHVPISAIVSRNHIANPDRLSEGQTLLIPPAPPLKLIITPPEGQPGQAFQLKLTGAVPSETIRFEIDSATGKYTGGPHTASADGAVTATYQTDLAGPTGIYNVTATGNLGTTVRAGFVVVAAATTDNT